VVPGWWRAKLSGVWQWLQQQQQQQQLQGLRCRMNARWERQLQWPGSNLNLLTRMND
jgi:hypothetical protein